MFWNVFWNYTAENISFWFVLQFHEVLWCSALENNHLKLKIITFWIERNNVNSNFPLTAQCNTNKRCTSEHKSRKHSHFQFKNWFEQQNLPWNWIWLKTFSKVPIKKQKCKYNSVIPLCWLVSASLWKSFHWMWCKYFKLNVFFFLLVKSSSLPEVFITQSLVFS